MIPLAELRRLEAAATARPWGEGNGMVIQVDEGECLIEMVETEEDANLIVAARNALPDLLALLEEARQVVPLLRDQLEECLDRFSQLEKEETSVVNLRINGDDIAMFGGALLAARAFLAKLGEGKEGA